MVRVEVKTGDWKSFLKAPVLGVSPDTTTAATHTATDTTTATDTATATTTATDTTTATTTATATELSSTTVTSTLTFDETSTSTAVVEYTATTIETITDATTTTQRAVVTATPKLANGDFEAGSILPWVVTAGAGDGTVQFLPSQQLCVMNGLNSPNGDVCLTSGMLLVQPAPSRSVSIAQTFDALPLSTYEIGLDWYKGGGNDMEYNGASLAGAVWKIGSDVVPPRPSDKVWNHFEGTLLKR
ncbi:hypothetical protein QBC39DRAFT_329410 [Podospora conica]|nr:hypothetical protein QBC39DRAFT_329410 [Schizothecium conicum]